VEKSLWELWEAARTAGPFGNLLLLFILWRVNKERRELLEQREALLERVLKMGGDTTEAVREIKDFFFRAGRTGRNHG
jgi:hypothetical protein